MFKKLNLTILIVLVLITAYLIYKNLNFQQQVPYQQVTKELGQVKLKVALLSDSHTSFVNLKKAVERSKQLNVDYIVHFGDMSDFGGVSSLNESISTLKESGISFFVLPGDRDVVEKAINYEQIVKPYECSTGSLLNSSILCLANPYNYTLINENYLNEFKNNINSAKVLFTSQPIYNPSSSVYMGYYDEAVKEQADLIYNLVNNSNIAVVVSGDAHFFSKYTNDNGLVFYTLGALSDTRNLQNPNFAILTIYDSGEVTLTQQYVY